MTNPTPQQQADHIEEKKELEREAMRLHAEEMQELKDEMVINHPIEK